MGALEGKTRQSKRVEEGSFNSISRDKYKIEDQGNRKYLRTMHGITVAAELSTRSGKVFFKILPFMKQRW